jgi:hypothetical protein
MPLNSPRNFVSEPMHIIDTCTKYWKNEGNFCKKTYRPIIFFGLKHLSS